MANGAADQDGVRMTLRILVVDDSADFRHTAGELLALRGFEVSYAADGDAALAAASASCPDGVLMDINLPGRDGVTVAADVAAACPTATIVLTSADVDHLSDATVRGCGARAFVAKVDLVGADLRHLFGPVRRAGT
jgi:CheY-like chemotaxis protein